MVVSTLSCPMMRCSSMAVMPLAAIMQAAVVRSRCGPTLVLSMPAFLPSRLMSRPTTSRVMGWPLLRPSWLTKNGWLGSVSPRMTTQSCTKVAHWPPKGTVRRLRPFPSSTTTSPPRLCRLMLPMVRSHSSWQRRAVSVKMARMALSRTAVVR